MHCFFFFVYGKNKMTTEKRMPASEPDSELSELVESFQKFIPAPSVVTQGPTTPETLAYLTTEMQNLKRRQTVIQEQIEGKNNEIVSLRETLLVVSGALQGLQHIHTFMMKEETAASSSSDAAGAAASSGGAAAAVLAGGGA